MSRVPSDEDEPKDLRVDELNQQILWELVRDARIPNNALAAKLHVAPSTTLTRVRALKDSGVLISTHADIDLRAVGLPLQALVAVRMRAQARAHLKTFVAKLVTLPAVQHAYFLGGADDFVVHVACTSPEQLRDFVAVQLSMDPGVASTQTSIVFESLSGHLAMDRLEGFHDLRRPITA